jgi:hypothetical protein
MSRPYRSHKQPACTFCRQRKSRCNADLPGQPCLLCRLHGKQCSAISSGSELGYNNRVTKRRRLSPEDDAIDEVIGDVISSSIRDNHTTHVVGPAIASDVSVLQDYLSNEHGGPAAAASDGPVLYRNIPRGRKGLSQESPLFFKQTEIFKQLFEPYRAELLKM